MAKRIVTLLICVLLAAGSVMGCAQTQPEAQPAAQEPAAQSAAEPAAEEPTEDAVEMIDDNTYAAGLPIVKEPITLKVVMVAQPAHGDIPSMEIFKQMEEQTNIHIEWTIIPSSSSSEQINLLLATGDLPDIFLGQSALSDNDITTYSAEGVFLPLDELIASYAPNITAAFEKSPAFKNACTSAEDGAVYSIGRDAERETKTNPDCLFIYQPWLDALNLETPTTTEEFQAVLTAFKTMDPNGNGKADEVPFSFTMGNKQNDLHSLFGSFGRVDYYEPSTDKPAHFVCDEDGTLVYTANTEEYKNAIIWMHDMFANGLFDQEGLTSKDTKALVALGNSEDVILGSFIGYDAANYVPAERIADYVAIAPLAGPEGERIWSKAGYENYNITGRGFVITNTNPNPAASIRWIDQFFDKDMSVQTFLGWEGVCMEKNAEGMWTYLPTPDGVSYNEFRFGNAPVHMPCAITADEWGSVVEVMGEDVYKLEILNSVYKPYQTNTIPYLKYNQAETAFLNSTGADITEYVNNRMMTWMLNGGIDAEWDSYCAKLEQMGLGDLYDTVNGAYLRMA